MDFKVAGTGEGVTALQMDIKIAGITEEIMKVALTQAKSGRMHILGEMSKALDKARSELGEYAPRIETFKIPTDKIREVIEMCIRDRDVYKRQGRGRLHQGRDGPCPREGRGSSARRRGFFRRNP